MRNRLTCAIAIAALGTAPTTLASNDDQGYISRPEVYDPTTRSAERFGIYAIFDELDRDDDERVSRAEAEKLKNLPCVFSAIDRNDNDQLTISELQYVAPQGWRPTDVEADLDAAECPPVQVVAVSEPEEKPMAAEPADPKPVSGLFASREAEDACVRREPSSAYKTVLEQRMAGERAELADDFTGDMDTVTTVELLSDEDVQQGHLAATYAALDDNGNDRVTRREALDMRGLADLFTDADYDCDGAISESEFFALAEDMGYDGATPNAA